MEIEAKSASRRILAGLAIILVITAFILVGLNALQKQNGQSSLMTNPIADITNPSASTDEGYVKGYLAARAKYQLLCPMVQTQNSKILSAKIASIAGSSMKVTPLNMDTDPVVDNVPDQRTVSFVGSTPIMKQTMLSPQEFAKILQNAQSQPGKMTTVPVPFTMTTSTISDLKVGQIVQITSDKETRLLETIPASSILILPQ